MMPRRAQPFIRLSLLASTVLLMGYSPMTIAAETATKPAAETGANPMQIFVDIITGIVGFNISDFAVNHMHP